MANAKGIILCSHPCQTEIVDYWNSRDSKSPINLPYFKIAHGRNSNSMEMDKHGEMGFYFFFESQLVNLFQHFIDYKPMPEASG